MSDAQQLESDEFKAECDALDKAFREIYKAALAVKRLQKIRLDLSVATCSLAGHVFLDDEVAQAMERTATASIEELFVHLTERFKETYPGEAAQFVFRTTRLEDARAEDARGDDEDEDDTN